MVRIMLIFGTVVSFGATFDQTTTPAETQPCKVPTAPNNGSVAIWGSNVLIEYACDPGLVLIGSSFGSCNILTKKWSIERPLCVYCDPPDNVTNGRYYYKHNGSMVTTVCNHGYKLVGTRRRYCDGYNWSGLPSRCIEKYSSRAGRRQAHDNLTTTPSADDIASHVLERDIEDADNTCYKKFTEPPAVEYAAMEITYKFNKVKQDWALIAKYTCALGYQYRDYTATYLYCKDYKWIGKKQPECVNAVVPPTDPCLTKNGNCEHVCIYNGGTSYQCDCHAGYHLEKYRRRCEDIVECEFDNGGCNQTCVNIIGSYFCTCNKGYVEHGNECHDVDECRTDGGHLCEDECINVPGSYECTCTRPGFIQSFDKTSCVDYNECEIGNDTCEDFCVNTHGSYSCKCFKKGYRLSIDGHSCVDIDECERYKTSRCLHGHCVNMRGSYKCICDPGYKSSRSGKKCLDINECKEDNGGCIEMCTNTPGNYSCSCFKNGYIIHGDTCEDDNECGYKNGGCEDVCINTDGSYNCSCSQDNYKLAEDGQSCIECSYEEFYNNISRTCISCPSNSIASANVTKSWSMGDCVCLPGYEVDSNNKCIDIDECTDGRLSCDQLCVNIPGSAYCDCIYGYMLIAPSICTDIDECLSDPCSQRCNNTGGSYYCYCDEGFYLHQDNHTCIDEEECVDDMIWCEHQCINTIGSAYCACDKGFTLDIETNNTCDDIDECKEGIHVCEETCINTVGSYTCDCLHVGFKLSWDLASCSDINECMEGENQCLNGCINTRGSYQCICDMPGYTRSNDKAKCEDIDECKNDDTNTCSDVCINTDGAYRCDCYTGRALVSFDQCAPCSVGYYRDNSTVECEPCPPYATTTTDGSTSITECVCMEGYTGNFTSGGDCIQTVDE